MRLPRPITEPGLSTLPADLYIVPQHGAEFLSPVSSFSPPQDTVTRVLSLFDIGGNRSRSHMGNGTPGSNPPHSCNGGDLHLVEQDDVLQFGGVADHRAGADQGAAPDKGPVAHLGPRADDDVLPDIGGIEHMGGFVDPDAGTGESYSSGERAAPKARMHSRMPARASHGYTTERSSGAARVCSGVYRASTVRG